MRSSDHVPQRIVRRIPPEVEPALKLLAAEGLPAEPTHLDLEDVKWGGQLVPAVKRIEVTEGGALVLEAQLPATNALAPDPALWKPEIFTGRVLSGGSIVIEQGASNIVRSTYGTNGSIVTARLHGWAWHVSDIASRTLWAAPLRFTTPDLPIVLWRGHGNLLLRVGNDLARGWRFETPQGLVFLVSNREQWFIAFWTATGIMPDARHVWLVLSVIGFVLGEELSVGVLRAVGEGVGAGFLRLNLAGPRSPKATRQPPALPFMLNCTWLARFVELVLQLAEEQSDAPLRVAISHYFESLDETIDSAFLHVWIGCEALAKWGIKTGRLRDGGPLRLANHDTWVAWVKAHEGEIKAHALAGKEQSLLDRVLASESNRPSPIQRVVRGRGLPWTEAMNDAEKVRNGVAHEGIIPGYSSRDWDRDRERVGLAKTMLTAMIAVLVGYDGPIADRSKTSFLITGRDEPDWWKAADLEFDYDYHGEGTDQVSESDLRLDRAPLE